MCLSWRQVCSRQGAPWTSNTERDHVGSGLTCPCPLVPRAHLGQEIPGGPLSSTLVQIPKEKTALLGPQTPHGAQRTWDVDDTQLCPGCGSRHGQSCMLTRSPRLGWPYLLSCGRSAPGNREGRGGARPTASSHPALIRSATPLHSSLRTSS